MTSTVPAGVAQSWVRRWDTQQERYVADREERFTVIGDVVAHAFGATTGTVLDLGCGPGSLSARLAERLPGSRIIGIDADPLLLGLARGRYGDVAEFIDTDLGGPGWTNGLPDVADAAVSTTALHWLEPDELAELYRTLAGLLRPGGVFVNGDHLPCDEPAVDELAKVVRDRRAERVGVTGNEEWTQWWDAVRADPDLGALAEERSQRAIAHHGSNSLSAREHADLLRSAGFSAAGPVWQSGDDHVLVAVR